MSVAHMNDSYRNRIQGVIKVLAYEELLSHLLLTLLPTASWGAVYGIVLKMRKWHQ
jgi:hypothetical protein